MEDKVAKKSVIRGKVIVPAVVAALAAILLCASYFMPLTTAKEDLIVMSEFAQTYEVNEGSGLTMGDLSNPSIVTWARFYKAYCDRLGIPVTSSLNDGSVMFWVIVASGVAAGLVLLFAVLRKAVPTTLFALVNFGLISLVGYYFESYGPVSSGAASEWAFGHVVMIGSAIIAAAAGVWLFIAKRVQKKADTTV